ncbi:hypothetical protein [Nocardioides sp.]|uniref:hypothetical protein n=1 Tax=Nocardioides sp. TaxID=35761 RepID=UPI002EDB7577
MIAERTATTTWEGSLARGDGRIEPDSGASDALPVTWPARTEAPGGKTSPEELAAVDEAAALCPISRLFAGAAISLSAELGSA